MNFVDLKTGYLLMGFADFESALLASEELCENGFKIAYLNETSHVRELEVRDFTQSFETADRRKYQNYHFLKGEEAKEKANESFCTALEVLEQKSSCKAKFVMVIYQAKAKQLKKTKVHLEPEEA
ncbi:hypothetical protein ACFSKU_05585 [Pontibacter silvestris]|uniref:Uncharacterized protein n=1 Tax=Pontibacter silvestris TaxID=2305183 RepID=A0ABW4WUC9_9BACT|nr:hypothetical protein [Pontibacter silvestris]MCC9137009.1 hypothetical protein [Pontibacter silvestris]